MIVSCLFFFFNDTATTEIYTLSLHDALPILQESSGGDRGCCCPLKARWADPHRASPPVVCNAQNCAHPISFHTFTDRKSTRLNSSHANISYAVFCLKKKKNIKTLYYILNQSI